MISRLTKQICFKPTGSVTGFTRQARLYTFVNKTSVNTNEARIPVYETVNFSGFSNEDNCSNFAAKVNSNDKSRSLFAGYLTTLGLASLGQSPTGIVIKMDLLEQSKAIELTYLTSSGLSNLRPLHYDDLAYNQGLINCFPHENLDIELCYEVMSEHLGLLFEKDGKWHEKGVNNSALSLENNWNEAAYLDPIHREH